jgi:hypothetical protein
MPGSSAQPWWRLEAISSFADSRNDDAIKGEPAG